MRRNAPTLHLLNSSTLVGFSGGLRLYLAYILAGIIPDIALIAAASLIIYATYTLDRSLGHKEDQINRRELSGANYSAGLAASGFAIMVGTLLFFSKYLFIPPLFPFMVGFLYSRGIHFRGKEIKLKSGAGVKNMVIGITWGGTIGLIIAATGHIAAAAVIAFFFTFKLLINSAIFDLKDVEGDLCAGIRTLPVCLGEQKLKYLLFVLCIIQHMMILLAIVAGILVHATVFLIYSWGVSSFVIVYYTPEFESDKSWLRRKFRILGINGEPVALFGLSILLPY
jgi:4-hydroxybenzoate polyprenyltransferase